MSKILTAPASRLICLGRGKASTNAVEHEPIQESRPHLGFPEQLFGLAPAPPAPGSRPWPPARRTARPGTPR